MLDNQHQRTVTPERREINEVIPIMTLYFSLKVFARLQTTEVESKVSTAQLSH